MKRRQKSLFDTPFFEKQSRLMEGDILPGFDSQNSDSIVDLDPFAPTLFDISSFIGKSRLNFFLGGLPLDPPILYIQSLTTFAHCPPFDKSWIRHWTVY